MLACFLGVIHKTRKKLVYEHTKTDVCVHTFMSGGWGNLSTQMTDYIEVSEDLNYVEGKNQRS